jgi:hypothetical protein
LEFVILFFIPVLVILLGATIFSPAPDQPPRVFLIGERISFGNPGRPAIVQRWWNPTEAAERFPNGVGGVPPPYRDGVVEATFVDLDANGRPYPNVVELGTSAQRG